MKKSLEVVFRVMFLFVYVFSMVPPQAVSAAPVESIAASSAAPASVQPVVESSAAPGPVPAQGESVVMPAGNFSTDKSPQQVASMLRLLGYSMPGYPVYNPQNGLSIEPITAYNLIVDSNVTTPASYGPSAATMGAKFCNTNPVGAGNTLTDVWAYIGDYNSDYDVTVGEVGDAKVGTFPRRFYDGAVHTPPNYYDEAAFNATYGSTTNNILVGSTLTDYGVKNAPFALKLETGTAPVADEASRFIGTLAPGQCKTEYWLVSYPRMACSSGSVCDVNNGSRKTVTGDIKPDDDLWLPYFFWGTSTKSTTATSYRWNAVTMRNEISAMANKIWPNGDNKVPDQYVAAIQQILGWDTWTPSDPNGASGAIVAYPGESVISQGIWYDLGNVGAGFDNNGDFTPDRNAWVQPIGDANSFDPGCFRLVRTYGLVIVKLNDGTEMLIPFIDQMYFENIPDNNNGAVGLVFYEYVALDGACTAGLTPYQEVASGYDNEKFNGDFGAGTPPLQSQQSIMTFAKTASPTLVNPSAEVTYNLSYTNVDPDGAGAMTVTVGNPGGGTPFIVQDKIPTGTCYVAGSAFANTGNNLLVGGVYTPSAYTVMYSTDTNPADGIAWQLAQPGDTSPADGCNDTSYLRWLRTDQVANGSTGKVEFKVSVPSGYVATNNTSIVTNTGCIKLGEGPCFKDSTTITPVSGNGTIGDRVWKDENGDGVQQATGEDGISGVTVYLYYDTNNNKTLDAGEPLITQQDTTTATGTNPNYLFTLLPAGNYIVKVNTTDDSLPTGYSNSTSSQIAVTLTATAPGNAYNAADFGFAPVLRLDKHLDTPDLAVVDELVKFHVDLVNTRPGDGTSAGNCVYDVWASTTATETGGDAKNKEFLTIPFATGAPNGAPYSTGDFATGSNRWISGSGFNSGGRTSAITKVEALYDIFMSQRVIDDGIGMTVSGGPTAFTHSFTYSDLNMFAPGEGEKGYMSYAVPAANAPGSSWDWGDFALLTLRLDMAKSAGSETALAEVDAMGFRVTTNDTSCADGDSTISLLPLKDIYDPAFLEFVSAEPRQSSQSAGAITWDNLGPLYAGGTKTVEITFKALQVTDTYTRNNAYTTATQGTQAKFSSGRSVNDASDYADVIEIANDASISGRVFANTDSGAWINPSGTGPGYSAADTSIPGVQVQLWACYSTTTGAMIVPSTPGINPNQDCAPNGGAWVQITTQNTAIDGTYSFIGLRNGYYNVIVNDTTLPTGFTTNSVETDNTGIGAGGNGGDDLWHAATLKLSDINDLTAGEVVTVVSFGYRDDTNNQGAVVGRVWQDSNHNGIWENTEDPIPGASAYRCTTTPCTASTPGAVPATTDSLGFFRYGNVAPGNYYVGITTPAGMSQSGDPDYPGVQCTSPNCDNQTTTAITVVANGVKNAGDFGYTGGLSIGDTLYTDWNGNHTQDSGDEGISGVVVYLYRDVNGNGVINSGEPLIESQTTDSSGHYLFSGLAGSSAGIHYVVKVNTSTIPGGYTLITDPVGALDSLAPVSLTTTSNPDIDFGYQPKGFASIGDTIWRDTNNNGIQNTTESGIPGVVVNLYQDDNGNGVIDSTDALVGTRTTDSSGKYLFTNLYTNPASGTKYIVQVDSSNFNAGGALNKLVVSGDPDTTKDGNHALTLTGSTAYLTADFGYVPLGSFGDTVYWDANGNGTQDFNEPGIPNVIVYLYTFTDAGNKNGTWQTGEGYLDTTFPAGYTLGEPFYDTPDGRYQPGENISSTPYATVVTDSSGKYLFTSLPVGDYVAVVETSAATIDIDLGPGTNNITNPVYYINHPLTADPDADGVACADLSSPAGLYEVDSHFCDSRAGMQILGGTNFLGADFGYQPSGVFGDTLWIDSILTDHDNNPATASIYGIRDSGEAGIPNITVTATTTPPNGAVVNGVSYNGSTSLTLTATTDINGDYSFKNITTSDPLTWTVAVTTGGLPAGLSNTYDPDGGTANQAQVVMAADGTISSIGTCTVALNPDGCDNESDPLKLDVDFGYRYTGTLDVSGTVCLETTGADGFCGADSLPDSNPSDDNTGTTSNEVAYDNVTVYLLRWIDAGSTPNGSPDPGETVMVASTTTDASGNYIFDNVPQSPSSGTSIYYIVAIASPQDGVKLSTDANNGTTDIPVEAVDAYPAAGNTAFLGVSTTSDGDTLSVFEVVKADYGTTAIDGVDFAFQLNGSYDFGDLPQGTISGTTYKYSTTLAGTPDGPRHVVLNPASPDLYLGNSATLNQNVSADTDGYYTSVSATLDQYDNGVTLGADTAWQDGGGSLNIVVTTPASGGYLVGWIDFNSDGDFNDLDEIVVNRSLNANLTQSNLPITFPTPYGPTYQPSVSGLYARFRLFPTSPIVPTLAYSGPATSGEVEDYRLAGMTTPVTVAYFRAKRQGSTVNFTWSTSTEVENLGFNLYAEDNGQFIQVNKELIPSRIFDSLERQDYFYSADAVGNIFYVEDVSLAGEIRQNGPFHLGQEYGEQVENEKIDQDAVTKAHAVKVAESQAALKRDMKVPASALLPEVTGSNELQLTTSLNLKVNKTGIYRVTYELLKGAGLDLAGVPLRKVTLTNRGQQVPVYVEGKAKFGPGAYIEFYGEALDTMYTDTNVYTIQISKSPAERMQVNNAMPGNNLISPVSFVDTLVMNHQRRYTFSSPSANQDAWYDTALSTNKTPKSWEFPFELKGFANSSDLATLELVVWGATSYPQYPDHHLEVRINGIPVSNQTFDGKVETIIEVTLPAGVLKDGSNSLQLTLLGDTAAPADMVYFDRFSLSYPRLYQAQNGQLGFTSVGKAFTVANLPSKNVLIYRLGENGPERLGQAKVDSAGTTFTATFAGTNHLSAYFVTTVENLYTPKIEAVRLKAELNRPAQLLIISNTDFIGGLEPLVQARKAQGLTVSIVDVTDVYSQYTYGIFDPQAIKDYIAYASQNLGTQYVLLVGGDTYDYRNYLGSNGISFIPTLYTATIGVIKFAPSDPLYTDLNGDGIPDLAIGRFPVRTIDQLNLMVQKTLSYARKDYGRTSVFVADKQDSTLSFKDISNSMILNIPAGWSTESINLDDVSAALAKQRLLAAMNRGTALVTFTGHSGATEWTASKLFNTTDASKLTNAGRPFVVAQWGCWNTYYVHPTENYLVQSLLFSGDKGAAAVLGASSLTEAESEKLLGQLLTPKLVTPGKTIGQALQDAKNELAVNHPNLRDVLLGWTLMGDPTLVIEP